MARDEGPRRSREAFSQLAGERAVSSYLFLPLSHSIYICFFCVFSFSLALPFASSLAWTPFISSDQWDRNKMDTEPETRPFFRHTFPLPPARRGSKRARAEPCSAFSPYGNRCRAGGQPTRIHRIHKTYKRRCRQHRSVKVYARASSRLVTYECA